jgi:hypothetical protein
MKAQRGGGLFLQKHVSKKLKNQKMNNRELHEFLTLGRDGNGQGRVRVKHLPARWHTMYLFCALTRQT